MKKLLFILSVVLALGSCSQTKPLSGNPNNVNAVMYPGEWEPMISSEGELISHAIKREVLVPKCLTPVDTAYLDGFVGIVRNSITPTISLTTEISKLTQCHVDLQAISIDPGTPWLTKGKKTFIQAVMKNNGPHVIPAGQATCHITINNRFLSFPYKYQFSSNHWMLVAVRRNVKGQVNLFFRNKSDMPVGTDTFLQFGVGGKAVGVADVTLASSLSKDASCGDVDGENQSVRTEVIITK